MGVSITDFSDRDFKLVSYGELKESAGSDRPHNSGKFYECLHTWGQQQYFAGQVVDHRPFVIVHHDEILGIATSDIPSVLGITAQLRCLNDTFTKTGLTLEWFERCFRFGADVVRCQYRGRSRFCLVNPAHAAKVLPMKQAIAC